MKNDKSEDTKLTNIIDEEDSIIFLSSQMKELKAPSFSVAASMFSKRYAYLIVSSTLYSMAKYNYVLYFPLKACAFNKERNLIVLPSVSKWIELEDLGREQRRQYVINSLFSTLVIPIFHALEKTSGIPSSILWENVAVRINSIYRKMLKEELDPVVINRLLSDFYFLRDTDGHLFNLKENPINRYLKIGEELELNPNRKTCCMYHKLEEDIEGIGYCANCPIIK